MFGSSKVSNVGVIGLGIIGSRVAECLRRTDHNVFVWSRTTRPIENFLASPQEIAEVTQIIQIFVQDSDALLEIMEEMKPALQKHHIILCHSTVTALAMKQAAAIAQDMGASFLDAPFTGSKVAAERGELVYYIGGDEAELEKARKILEASSKKIIHFGAVGTATVLKIATNLISAAVVEALAESLAIIKAHDIAPEKLLEALVPNANCSPLVTMKLPTMISGTYEPHFSLKNMLKDSRYAQELARAKGLPTPVLDATNRAMEYADNAGRGESDFSIIMENFTDATSAKTQPAIDDDEEPASLKASKFESKKPVTKGRSK